MPYMRKTEDEYQIWGFYGAWEELTASNNRKESLNDLKAYRTNEPGKAFKMIKKRIKKEATK